MTVIADLKISATSHGQYRAPRNMRCSGRLSPSTTASRAMNQTVTATDASPSPISNGS